MSVLQCNRNGCTNIMCDRHSDNFGYICHDCLEELAEQETVDIKAFMDSPKTTGRPPVKSLWALFLRQMIFKPINDR